MPQKILIVGGVGGGATVAAQIRRNNKQAEIIIFDKGDYISFSNCGMPYYIGEVVANRDDILVSTDQFKDKYEVDIRTNSEVISINRSEKHIRYENKSGVHEEAYDKLILSPGAQAIVPEFAGLDANRTFTLHTIPDMDNIYTFIKANKPKTAAIVGAGFIGMEVVENLHSHGIQCTVIDRSKQVMKIVDEDLASIIQDHLMEKNVEVILNEGLDHFTNNGKTLVLHSGASVDADMTILALGIKPNTALATKASLALGETRAIKVNDFMQTNDPSIYALGDVIETKDFLTKVPRHIALAWPAHRQAFIIASHLNGEKIPYNGTLGSSILKIFDLTVSATGLTSAALQKMGRLYKEATLASYSHASYFPGAEKLWMKLLFDGKDGTIYGAQVVGYDGADKRLAVLATALKARLTVADLSELELAYAPPYSNAKDPVNILGYKASAMVE